MSSLLADNARDRAFERLYERYVREVYRYVFAVLRNPSEAEDVTQTTFLNAYRAIQAGAEPQRPHNWLMAIAHNACRSRARFVMRRPKEVPLDELVEQLVVPESERLNVGELLRALGRLPRNQRSALTMRELEGCSYPEIAESLGVTVPAVEALIARARRSLRLQSAALRGLAIIQLPRSLRKLFEPGDVVGTAIGAGAVTKAAAVLVAGVVASSAGSAATVQTHNPQRAAAPRVELRHGITPRAILTRRSTQRFQARVPASRPRPVRAMVVPRLRAESTDAVGSAGPPAGAAHLSIPAPLSTAPAPVAPALGASGAASLPEMPSQPVEQLPQPPDPPPLPGLPALPSLTLP